MLDAAEYELVARLNRHFQREWEQRNMHRQQEFGSLQRKSQALRRAGREITLELGRKMAELRSELEKIGWRGS